MASSNPCRSPKSRWGNRARVRRQKFPVDGIIDEGASAIDESMLTGEWVPVDKTAGSDVFGGTISTSGSFCVTATNVGADSALRRSSS